MRPAWSLRRWRFDCVVFGLLPLAILAEVDAGFADVCSRTAEVKEALVAASGAETCAEVDGRDLRDITTLDLGGQGIASLGTGDFEGLDRLESLDLSDNLLSSLTSGVFDELYLLKTLHLDGNELESLPADIFDQLFLLEELTLDDNSFSSLPDGLFAEFSRFDGMQANGDPPDNSGSYPRIQRFLDGHSVSSPEEFIEALPALYKQRFAMMYESKAAAQDSVSVDHPRIIAWGADGNFIFAWNTDPDAPSQFRDVVEFLRQDETAWTAGIVDFSGTTPEITEPDSCKTCHGSLNKPLWSIYNQWEGSEFDYILPRAENMAIVLESTDPRIEPLEFPSAAFRGDNGIRFVVSPHGRPVVAAVEEAGAVWSWRHAEVLLRILKTRHSDFRSWAEEALCGGGGIHRWFDQEEHNLVVLANAGVETENGKIVGGLYSHVFPGVYDELLYSYVFHSLGFMSDAMRFLLIAELWQEEPVVRHLYRTTPNGETVHSRIDPALKQAMLHFSSGSATAEDELIQRFRLHFGQGGVAALDLRARQNDRFTQGGVLSATFGDAHVAVMKSRVCETLAESAPKNLAVALESGDAVLSWDAPRFDAGSVTGYRILRGVDGESPAVHVADTGSTGTTWSDENPELGDYVYILKTLYDDYYPSPDSDQVETTVVAFPEAVQNLTAEAGPARVTLRWDAPGGETAPTGYRVRRGQSSASLELLAADSGSTATSYVDGTVAEGETYFYSVAALNGKAAGPESEVVQADVPRSKPTAPNISSVSAGRRAVTVSWAAPSDTGSSALSAYDLRYIASESADKADANWTGQSAIWTSGALEYTLAGLTDATGYDVQVRAVNDSGAGPWSNTGTATTLPNRVPLPVGSLVAPALQVGDGDKVVEVSGAFEDPDDDTLTYGASSSSPGVARVRGSGSQVTLTPVAPGAVTVTVTATDVAGSNTPATQWFEATVAARRGVTVSRSAFSVREGSTATYAVVLDSKPTGPVTVTPSVQTGTDVSVNPSSLTFTMSNWSVRQTVTIRALEDTDAVADAPVTIRHEVSGSDYGSVVAPTLQVTIVETDTPTLWVDSAQASEGAGEILFLVTLSTESSNEVLVDYATSDGSGTTGANHGSDYTAASGTLTFSAGSTAPQQILVDVTDDSEDEAEEETFSLTLRNPRNASLAGGSSVLQVPGAIQDDDDPEVEVSLVSASYEAVEGATARIGVRLSGDPEREVKIPLVRIHQGGATQADYSGVPAEVIFVGGVVSVDFLFAATDDSEDDDGEALVLRFGTLPARVTGNGETTVAIRDNDGGGGGSGGGDVSGGGGGGGGGGASGSGGGGGGSPAPDTDPPPVPDPPRLTARFTAPAMVETGVPGAFDGSGSTGAESYSWDFGDGSAIEHPSARSRPSHMYVEPGSYEVRLEVARGGDCGEQFCSYDAVTATVEVDAGLPPAARFDLTADCGDDLCVVRTGVEVTFRDSSGGTVAARSWDFGDGVSSSAREPGHSWSSPGFYRVELVVSGLGMESSAGRDILVRASDPAGDCEPDGETLCLRDSRYEVLVDWWNGDGKSGSGEVVHGGTNDSGLFRFFSRENWEVLIKVLDGCAHNGHVWVFGASTTDLGYSIRVTDTVTGMVKEYRNEPGVSAPAITDGTAFPGGCAVSVAGASMAHSSAAINAATRMVSELDVSGGVRKR